MSTRHWAVPFGRPESAASLWSCGTRGQYREWQCGFVRPRTNPIPIRRSNLCDDGQTGNHGLDVLPDRRADPTAGCNLFSARSCEGYPSLFPRGVYREASRLPATLFTAESMFTEIGNKLFIAQLPRRRDFVINARGNEQPARAVTSAIF